MSKIVVVGAGKTGRGFIGRLLQEAGEQVIFIDKGELMIYKRGTGYDNTPRR